MTFKYKLIIAVRTDLKLSKGKLAAQVAHASVDCALKSKQQKPTVFRNWHYEGQKKVVVKVASLDALLDLKAHADKNGLITSLIQDAGMTEVTPGTTTCLGIGPGPEEDIDLIAGDLPLM